MSSIFDHALIGAAIGENAKSTSKTEKAMLCLFYAALSIAPDLDYLPTWVFGFNMEPRYSHSIGGCLLISVIGLLLKKYCPVRFLKNAAIALIFMSPFSHLLMDFMVGVHKNPIFWPFSSNTFASNLGVLPSAGELSVTNRYFWRNLAIELGVLIPLALAISKTGREVARNNMVVCTVAIFSFLLFGYVSYGLHR